MELDSLDLPDYEEWPVWKLKMEAKRLGFTRYSHLNKDQLLIMLYSDAGRQRALAAYRKLSKDELIDALLNSKRENENFSVSNIAAESVDHNRKWMNIFGSK